MNIEQELEIIAEQYKNNHVSTGRINVSSMAQECLAEIKKLKRDLLHYKAKEARNKKQFDYIIGNTKAGNKFIKVLYLSYEADGWVEVGRIRLTKSEWIDGVFSIEDVLDELKR